MATEQPIIAFASQADFARWLEANHAESDGIWLKFAKKGTGVETVVYAEVLEVALCFGWIDGQVKRRDEESFRQRFTPRRPKSPWSARNVGHIARLTTENRMTPAGQAAVDAAKADGRWQAAYLGPAAAEVPDDWAAALAASPAAQLMWDVLTSQNRYAITYRLAQLKRPETRIRRIAEFVAMLERGETVHPQKRTP
jgi:uncharacterized protein YdeI (YjbR/CyaY-like superfamily)